MSQSVKLEINTLDSHYLEPLYNVLFTTISFSYSHISTYSHLHVHVLISYCETNNNSAHDWLSWYSQSQCSNPTFEIQGSANPRLQVQILPWEFRAQQATESMLKSNLQNPGLSRPQGCGFKSSLGNSSHLFVLYYMYVECCNNSLHYLY